MIKKIIIKKQCYKKITDPRCASHPGVKLHRVHPTVESISALCITSHGQVIKIYQKAPWCAFHR